MKLTVVVATLYGLALASPTPPAAEKRLPWHEANFGIATKSSPLEFARQPEHIQGTWFYCWRFDGPRRLWPDENFTSFEDCRAKHYKAAWVPGNSSAPCDSDTGYKLENCGTIAYCMQYDIEGDQPFPALFDSSDECLDFYESGPVEGA